MKVIQQLGYPKKLTDEVLSYIEYRINMTGNNRHHSILVPNNQLYRLCMHTEDHVTSVELKISKLLI